MKSRRKPPKSACVCSFTQISDGVTDSDHSFMSVDLLGVLWSFMCVHQVPPNHLPPLCLSRKIDVKCTVHGSYVRQLRHRQLPPPITHLPAGVPVRWIYRSGRASSCCCTLITENPPLPLLPSYPRSDKEPRSQPV